MQALVIDDSRAIRAIIGGILREVGLSVIDSVRIIMVTTETQREQVLRALDAGANEYVMKPFTKEVLVAKLSLLDVFGA